ncbi:DUF1016 N-terminal domain-containing protein [Raoultibacter phocaeensis]|uniref:DUF1016 N-terminal domain-containing protein n=1 Tax=Raoultibacter phocaeensis TaxID=2479841 RepID=UPI001118F63E|nr:DUF1016 N-terminal domain-containing protein [Raoultibacter phocaeensis]
MSVPLTSPEFDPSIYKSIRETLEEARRKTRIAVNEAIVIAYWEIGRQIVEAQGERAEYGKRLMKYLSGRLTEEFGKGFTERNLQAIRQFYLAFRIPHALRAQLIWTHYRLIIRLADEKKRHFYMNEAANEGWSSRQLERQIHSSYYEHCVPNCSKPRERSLWENGRMPCTTPNANVPPRNPETARYAIRFSPDPTRSSCRTPLRSRGVPPPDRRTGRA